MKKQIYVSNDVVVAIGWVATGAQATISLAGEGVVALEADMASAVDVGWTLRTGENGPEFVAPAAKPPTIGPNEFHFLWTMAEQVAIEDLRGTDPVVKLFMRRLDDPRTTEVVLADPAVQGAVRHTVEQLVAAGKIAAEDAETRVATIIAGGRQ